MDKGESRLNVRGSKLENKRKKGIQVSKFQFSISTSQKGIPKGTSGLGEEENSTLKFACVLRVPLLSYTRTERKGHDAIK